MAMFLEQPVDRLVLGERFVSRGRTICESDFVQWCALTGDWHVMHSDAVHAGASQFGQRIAPGLMVLAYATGLGIPADSPVIIANYGTDRVRFVAPVFIGDTIRLDAAVQEIRPRREGVDAVVRVSWNAKNQNDTTVMTSELLVLMAHSAATELAR